MVRPKRSAAAVAPSAPSPPPPSPPKSSTPLENCAITFVSNVPFDVFDDTSVTDATVKSKTEIVERGGSYVSKVDQCTHLVVTRTQYARTLVKVKEAIQKDDVHIVSFDWLKEAFKSGDPVDETPYILHLRPQSRKSKKAASSAKKIDSDDRKNEPDTATTAPRPKRGQRELSKTEKDGDAEQQQPKTKKKKVEDFQPNVTQNLALKIPLDEAVPVDYQTAKVHIADDSTIFDVTMNQTDAMSNANKFYRMQILQKPDGTFYTWTRWGRVGEKGQTKMLGNGTWDTAFGNFQKKFKEKSGNTWENRNDPIKPNKYAFIERSYEDSDDEDGDDGDDGPGVSGQNGNAEHESDEEEGGRKVVESELPEQVQQLMKLIFNTEIFSRTFDSFDYDAKKMPLGKLSKNSLMRGYEVLKQLAAMVGSQSSTQQQLTALSNQYLSLIPHVVRRSSRPPVLNDMKMIKKEIDLLETLTDMQLANDIMKLAKKDKPQTTGKHLLDRQYEGLNLQEMTPLEPKSSEFKELQSYLDGTVGYTHGTSYKVENIFRIERTGENDRFAQSAYANLSKGDSDRRLLWHGSRCTNFGGILSQGLRIAPPEAPVSGYMFGKGVYLADMSSKSAGYCCSGDSGGTGLLLLCDAELGTPPLKLTNASYDAGATAKKQGSISTWGVGSNAPQAWKDAGCVNPDLKGISMPDVVSKAPGATNEPGAGLYYNEYIVYDVAQIKLRYLFMVKM